MRNSTINISDHLRASREEMYGAFELFHTHVKYTTSLMVSFLTALIAIAVIAEKLIGFGSPSRIVIFQALGSGIFLMILPIGHYSKQILRRYFRVYVAAMQFSDMLHKKYDMDFHPWLITEGESEYVLTKNEIKSKLDRKSKSKELSCALYLNIINSIMLFAGLISLILLLFLDWIKLGKLIG